MHINPRFNAHGDERAVVCNSYQGGNWCEEHREGGFPFHQGEEFKVSVLHCDWMFQPGLLASVFLLVTSAGQRVSLHL